MSDRLNAVRILADKVERWDITDLLPYALNAKRHPPEQIAKLAELITEFGFTVPVLIDENGEILAGHGRVLAAEQLGMTEVPVIVARGWTEAQKRAYRLADNQVALGGDWDEEILKAELAELRVLAEGGELDLGLTAFDPKEIDKMFAVVDAPAEFKEFAETIETDHKCPKCGYAWSGKTS